MNPRIAAIRELGRLYSLDEPHAAQVESLAGVLFDALRPLHGLDTGWRRLLEHAAYLHDVGRFLTDRRHHLFSRDLILMEPLPDFSRTEKLVIANVARYHRKALPTPEHVAFALLPDEERSAVCALSAILRVADALDHGHTQAIREVRCALTAEELVLHLDALGDLSAERASVELRQDLFRNLFSRNVRLEQRAAGGVRDEGALAAL